MNKGLQVATGRFVCFLNAGDVFASDDLLKRVHDLLATSGFDGALGWGELNGQIWSSWIEHEAFKLASLGFCHQSLFVRRELLDRHPFDERSFKTDSDTLQLGRLYAAGARIPIVPEVWAVRGGEPGISANLERTKASIATTLQDEYGLDVATAEQVIAFRRQCTDPEAMAALLTGSLSPLCEHLALMVLDTLFLRQSVSLDAGTVERLYDSAVDVLSRRNRLATSETIERLLAAQAIRQAWLAARAEALSRLKRAIAEFQYQEQRRVAKLRATRRSQPAVHGDYIVSLTSFPARIQSLHLVVQSLIEQSLPPREIHVWLGRDEIAGRSWLPRALLEFESAGLRIHFSPRTFHQYDKFLHSGARHVDRPFVIVDDDVIYPTDSMQALVDGHRLFPKAVVANRCHRMAVSPEGFIRPYGEWAREIRVERPSLTAFPTGAGGVLYPPGFLSQPLVLQVRDVLANAPYADDLWLKACALALGIPTMSTRFSDGASWYLRYTPTMREGALHATNVDLGLNDMQMRRLEAWLTRVRPDWREALAREVA
jgi:hypothetical protein